MQVSITDFGAKPNVDENQAQSIQAAIDKCFSFGGGTVTVPKGTFVTGSIRLRSNTTLKLLKGAILLGSKDLKDYTLLRDQDLLEPIPEKFLPEVTSKRNEESFRHWHYALIHVYAAKNVAVIGEEGSCIDGNNVFDPEGEEGYRGPHAISILKSENVTMKGYCVHNSSNWAHNCWLCKNLRFENVTVLGGHDGIDFFGSDHVTVQNCKLFSGDDCIAGFDNQNVTVKGCIINSSCSGFRFSGKHVLIENCNVYGPGEFIHRNSLSLQEKAQGKNADSSAANTYRNNMLSFFTYYADHRLKIRECASDIVINDCTVNNCDRFVLLKYGENERWQCNKPLTDITFKNVTGTGIKIPITLKGDPNDPVSLYMENCNVDFHPDYTAQPLVKCANYKTITLKNVSSNFCGNSLILSYGGKGEFNVEGGNTENKFSVESDELENFTINSI
ncbi:MAG: hypothetical protein IJ506_05205 [Clostridia bacterium]|nr:hypothetical protein [Clostridia bacterium]